MYCTAKIFALGAHLEVVIAVSLPAFALLRFKQDGQSFAYLCAPKAKNALF